VVVVVGTMMMTTMDVDFSVVSYYACDSMVHGTVEDFLSRGLAKKQINDK